MSGTTTPSKDSKKDGSRQWAALDCKNERLASSAELLLLDLKRDRKDAGRSLASQPLKAAS
jgi:hypothetical protein